MHEVRVLLHPVLKLTLADPEDLTRRALPDEDGEELVVDPAANTGGDVGHEGGRSIVLAVRDLFGRTCGKVCAR